MQQCCKNSFIEYFDCITKRTTFDLRSDHNKNLKQMKCTIYKALWEGFKGLRSAEPGTHEAKYCKKLSLSYDAGRAVIIELQ